MVTKPPCYGHQPWHRVEFYHPGCILIRWNTSGGVQLLMKRSRNLGKILGVVRVGGGSRWSVGIHELIQLHKGLASFLWQIEWWLGEEFKRLRRLRWNSRRNHRWLFSWWNMVERFKVKAVPTPKHHWILLKSSFLFTSCFNSRSIHDDMMWYGACSSSLVLLFLPTAVFQPGDQARSPRTWLGGKSGERWPSNKRPTKRYWGNCRRGKSLATKRMTLVQVKWILKYDMIHPW